MIKTVILLVTSLLVSFNSGHFKTEQKRYSRVRVAYAEKEAHMKKLLLTHSIRPNNMEIYLQVFKKEKELELWAKNKEDQTFKRIKTYKICQTSGTLGPKRQEGDLQIPEGFYHIDAYNPASSYYLSMRINYPNKSDRILSDRTKPGSNICIHGDCVTIGCVPITDDQIKELYLFCIEAKDKGQDKIPVTIYPARLNATNYKALCYRYPSQVKWLKLWADLHVAYQYFQTNKYLPSITFLPDGRHSIK